jgi:selenium metabolism protein YedF
MGDQCPIPVVKTMKALAAMTEAGTVEVHVDYEVPVQNLTRFAAGRGLPVSSEKLEEKHYVVRMEVADPAAASAKEETPGCMPDLRGDTVIAIASECMGNGDDQLGATLMKGFIYAVSQQEELPRAILFYNSGAKLTAEGAPTIEDLKSMEAQGVEILTCGTCANFFGLEGKQAVGSVTNMYAIVEKLTAADKVIRP